MTEITVFQQAEEQYSNMSDKEKETLVQNIAAELYFEREEIRVKILDIFGNVHEDLEKKLRKRLSF